MSYNLHIPWITQVDEKSGEEFRLLDPSKHEVANMLSHGGWEIVGLMDYMGSTFLAFTFDGEKSPPLAI